MEKTDGLNSLEFEKEQSYFDYGLVENKAGIRREIPDNVRRLLGLEPSVKVDVNEDQLPVSHEGLGHA